MKSQVEEWYICISVNTVICKTFYLDHLYNAVRVRFKYVIYTYVCSRPVYLS